MYTLWAISKARQLQYFLQITGPISRTTETIPGLFVLNFMKFYAESKYGNENLNFGFFFVFRFVCLFVFWPVVCTQHPLGEGTYLQMYSLKNPSSKWIDSSSEGHLQGSSSIWQGSSSKIVNWMRGQRSNKSLILIINITNRNKKPTAIFLTNI